MKINLRTVNFILSRFTHQNLSEILWVIAGQILTVAFNFVIIKLLSRMGTVEFGKYALIITIVVLLDSVLYGPITQGFIRFFYPYSDKGNRITYTSIMYLFVLITSVVVLAGGFAGLLIGSFFEIVKYSPLFIAGILFVTFLKSNEFFSLSLNILRRRKENSFLQAGEKIIMILILLLLIKEDALTLPAALFFFSGILFTFTLLKYFFFKTKASQVQNFEKKIDKQVSKEIISNILTYAAPFFIWGISGWLQLNGEKWIIAKLLLTSDVGIYAVMMTMVNALIILPNNMLSQFGIPIIFQKFSNPAHKENVNEGIGYINGIVVLTLCITAAASVVTYFFGEGLILLISNKNFTAYWYLLPLFALGTGLFYSGQAMTNLGLAVNQPKKYLAPKISTGIVSVLLNVFMIYFYGLNGLAFSIILIGIFYILYIYIINKKLKMNLNFIQESL
jgi:O-antigen/teichoic acid export membrane protein